MTASLFVGWPLDAPDAQGRLSYAHDARCLRDALWNVLMTSPGERLMQPAFGAGLTQWIGQPNTESTRQLIASSISTAIAKWEQRVSVVGIDVVPDSDNASRVLITLTYRARGQAGAAPDQLSFGLTLGSA